MATKIEVRNECLPVQPEPAWTTRAGRGTSYSARLRPAVLAPPELVNWVCAPFSTPRGTCRREGFQSSLFKKMNSSRWERVNNS